MEIVSIGRVTDPTPFHLTVGSDHLPKVSFPRGDAHAARVTARAMATAPFMTPSVDA
jgi:hypothetical protein